MSEQPQAVSFPTDFSPSDRIMWKIERDPVLRSAVLAVGVLDREPDWASVQRTFARAVDHLPRLRQRVEVSGPTARYIRWVDDPAFSLDYHLRRVRAPHPGDLRSALSFAAPFVASTLDPARPQWEFTLIEGMEGGRAAFVLKFHHTITDGVGGIDLAGSVFDTTRRGGGREPKELPASADASVPTITRVFDLARFGFDAVRQPTKTARAATRFAKSLGRMLAPVPEPLSPELRGRSLDRRLDVIELSMVQLRAAAHASGGTINDVFLAGMGGGMHDYHERLGHEVPALRVTMPISLRSENDPPGGNRFTPARFVLPIDDPDPAVRAQIAGNIARRWRAEPAVGMTEVLASVLDLLPPAVVTPLFASMLKNVDIDAVDVPGLTAAAYLGGGRIDRMWAFAPPTGAALSITLLSHADTACIGVVSDLAAVSDPELLVTCLEGAFEEVLALGVPAAVDACVAEPAAVAS
jgi:WS/DGAT/MGAT family acyltransferase